VEIARATRRVANGRFVGSWDSMHMIVQLYTSMAIITDVADCCCTTSVPHLHRSSCSMLFMLSATRIQVHGDSYAWRNLPGVYMIAHGWVQLTSCTVLM
jgi:hypothetical protein